MNKKRGDLQTHSLGKQLWTRVVNLQVSSLSDGIVASSSPICASKRRALSAVRLDFSSRAWWWNPYSQPTPCQKLHRCNHTFQWWRYPLFRHRIRLQKRVWKASTVRNLVWKCVVQWVNLPANGDSPDTLSYMWRRWRKRVQLFVKYRQHCNASNLLFLQNICDDTDRPHVCRECNLFEIYNLGCNKLQLSERERVSRMESNASARKCWISPQAFRIELAASHWDRIHVRDQNQWSWFDYLTLSDTEYFPATMAGVDVWRGRGRKMKWKCVKKNFQFSSLAQLKFLNFSRREKRNSIKLAFYVHISNVYQNFKAQNDRLRPVSCTYFQV